MVHKKVMRVNGVTYSLAHMSTVTHTNIPMEDWRGTIFKKTVTVIFSNHCYSKEVKDGRDIARDAFIPDGVRRREFHLERYELSLALPKIVYSMLISNYAVVWDTGKGNQQYNQLVGSPNINAAKPYYVFMRTSKEQAEGGPKLIQIAVESAYAITPPEPLPAPRKMRTVRAWLGATWENKLPK